MTFDEAIQAVIDECPDEYAKSYAQVMPQAIALGGKKDQILYILSNTAHWRGERAREVKAVLKAHK